MEHVRGVNWDLWGNELTHEQTIQRIVNAGFPIKGGVALTMFAIVEGESGEYQRAWHANVQRNTDGTIWTDDQGRMLVKSVDLGFMQFNTEVKPDRLIPKTAEAMKPFIEGMFEANPDLANPWEAADRAYDMWSERGFQPWYGYKPGTEEFYKKQVYGALAFANWLVHSRLGQVRRYTKEPLDMVYRKAQR